MAILECVQAAWKCAAKPKSLTEKELSEISHL
jgi:hypothetical protein